MHCNVWPSCKTNTANIVSMQFNEYSMSHANVFFSQFSSAIAEVAQFMTGCHHQHVNKPLMTRSLYVLPAAHGTFEDVENNLQSEYSGKQADNVEELVVS